jgi:hypothetical protein
LKAETQTFWEFNDFIAWHTDETSLQLCDDKIWGGMKLKV